MQAMASDSENRIEEVRKAIKSMPGRSDLLNDFTDQQLQKLADEHMTRVELFRMVSREQLQGLGIPPALAAELQAGAASTAVDALREKVLAMLANNGAELFGLKAAHHIAMSPKTCLSGTSLGRYVEVMPTFEKAAPPSELLPPPTPTQWKALFAALGLPEQPEDADWVRLLYPRELNAQRSKKRKHDDGLGYASSTPPVTFDPVPGPKEQVQLAVGNILRATESAGMTTLHWRDTSRCGGVAIEVTDELSGERMSQALGRIILMMQEQFSAQPSREKSFAVAIGRDFVDTVVYQVNIKKRKRRTSKAAILKICSPWLVAREASNLKRLKERGLADRCTKVVESGQLSEGMSYLISQPVGKQLSQDEDAMAILKLGKGLVENVALWHKHGLVHRDLSVSNVGLADDGDVLIWDFATMASVSATHGPREPGRWTGTWLYMAISVQQGGAWTLSSKLECIFYILIGLSLEDGAVHWRKSWPGDSDAKIAAMMDARTFDAKVLQRTRHQLRPLVQALHDLFFPLASTFVTRPSAPKSIQTTGSFYRTNVRAEEFLDTLASREKNLMTSTPARGDEHAKITDACEDGKKETAVAKRKLVQKKAAKRERTVGGSREGPARKKVKAVAQPKTMHIAAPTQEASQDKRRRIRKANAAAAQIGRRPHT
ncbi:g2059 [Coccomyxa viridis]|uniref:G2059 protein n=1 Tax=Coccomyxa viridis TaxID=1274662 RepID=A0ABP1FRF0_9CHLO